MCKCRAQCLAHNGILRNITLPPPHSVLLYFLFLPCSFSYHLCFVISVISKEHLWSRVLVFNDFGQMIDPVAFPSVEEAGSSSEAASTPTPLAFFASAGALEPKLHRTSHHHVEFRAPLTSEYRGLPLSRWRDVDCWLGLGEHR